MTYRRRYSQAADAAETGWASSLYAVASAITVLLVFVSAAIAETANPLGQPGTTWVRGILSGESLRLLDSGRYVRIPFCDVCRNTEISERGTWSSAAGRIRLQPDRSDQRPTVLLAQRDTLIEDERAALDNPGMAFVREDAGCDLFPGPDAASSVMRRGPADEPAPDDQ